MRDDEVPEVNCSHCPSGPRCWGDAPPPEAGILVRRVRPLNRGEILLTAGERFVAPFLVTSGCIAVTELLANGAERIVGFRVPGDIVGIESLELRMNRFGAKAVCASMVCRLRWGASGLAGCGAPLLRSLLSKSAGQSLRTSSPWNLLHAVDRVGDFVADHQARTGHAPPMTRAQMGQYLGISEETVVRAIGELRKRGDRRPGAIQLRAKARSHTP